MTLHGILHTLRVVLKDLRFIDRHIIQLEHENSVKLRKRFRLIETACFKTTTDRRILNTLTADLAVVVRLIAQYQALLQGNPLCTVGFDDLDADTAKTSMKAFFDSQTNHMSGLEYILRNDQDTAVTDFEVFDTYRAMGYQSFDLWEISMHRQVGAVSDSVYQSKCGLGLKKAKGCKRPAEKKTTEMEEDDEFVEQEAM